VRKRRRIARKRWDGNAAWREVALRQWRNEIDNYMRGELERIRLERTLRSPFGLVHLTGVAS